MNLSDTVRSKIRSLLKAEFVRSDSMFHIFLELDLGASTSRYDLGASSESKSWAAGQADIIASQVADALGDLSPEIYLQAATGSRKEIADCFLGVFTAALVSGLLPAEIDALMADVKGHLSERVAKLIASFHDDRTPQEKIGDKMAEIRRAENTLSALKGQLEELQHAAYPAL